VGPPQVLSAACAAARRDAAGPRAGFWGGSADLAPSNMTLMKAFGDFQKNQYQERNLRFGVREHGMGAICNGIALHNPGLIPYCATFFIFTGARRSPSPGGQTCGLCTGVLISRRCPHAKLSARARLRHMLVRQASTLRARACARADYMRSAIRMSALSEAGVIYVMTHDSIGLGEDGPTHQPIEQLASFRAMPNIIMARPGDGVETAAAYEARACRRAC